MFKTRRMILMVAVFIMFLPVLSLADILYVCPSGCPYSTIQSAIDASASGEILIRVAQGTYNELLSITNFKTLTLEGGWDNTFTERSADPSLTVINGSGAGNVIFIKAVSGSIIDVTVGGFTITNGQAFDGAGVHVEADGSGSSVTVSLENNIIATNYAEYGGGISGAAYNSAVVTLELNDNNISNNRAYALGGGFAINSDSSGSVTVASNNNTISDNTGDRGGGGIFLNPVGSGSSLDFTSNNDVINTNKTGYGYAGGGISIYCDSGSSLSLNISNSSISNNDATPGGGISINSTGATISATISNSTISGNYSNTYGGGFYIYDISSNLTLNLERNTISNNRAGNHNGGGIYYYSDYSSPTSSLNLKKNTISGNRSTGSGGGMYVVNSSNLTMILEKNSILSNGCINYGGGGIAISNYGTISLQMINNIIANNNTEYDPIDENYGGGIYIANTGTLSVTSINNTIAGNTADDGGGGIYVSSSSGSAELSFINDIIFDNTGPAGADIFNHMSTASISISYSDIGETFGYYIDGGSNINVEPLFVDPSNGDYHLTSWSLCIDVGTPEGAPEDDIDGNLRPQAAGYDMGADEYQAVSEISLSRNFLYFGTNNSNTTQSQSFLISNSGGGSLNWSITDDAAWLSCTPTSGTGTATVTVSVNPTGLSAGTYNGAVTVSDPNATNSPQEISVTLKVYNEGSTSPPFGSFDTPVNNSDVFGSVPVTGWALDDIEVETLLVKREPVASDPPGAIGPDGLVFIGNGVFVEGSRPDVEAIYSTYPLCYRAGWGYMLLTNALPNGGNGTFVLHAIAYDKDGHKVDLGTKTINVDNASSVMPFGAIDTPHQGGEASGASYVNFGWALTPVPNTIVNGTTSVNVLIDGVIKGNATYGDYRSDIELKYPGYNNSDGAGGHFYIDTTTYANGVHTISWHVRDDASHVSGIGSRFFSIVNTGSGSTQQKITSTMRYIGEDTIKNYQRDYGAISIKRGIDRIEEPEEKYTDDKGYYRVEMREVERVVIELNREEENTIYEGYMKVGNELRRLPIGSTLDRKRGVFYWEPGPGFIGEYNLIFINNSDRTKKNIKILIKPKFEKRIVE